MNKYTHPKFIPYRTRLGRLFYGISMMAYGVQQIIIQDFRPEILPPFPAWAHRHAVFPIVTGMLLIIAGVIITNVFTLWGENYRKVCLYTGWYFLLLLLVCHIPYNLIISPNLAIHLGVWAAMLKEVAFCGGAFVMAATYKAPAGKPGALESLSQKVMPLGRIFFSITMILFGYAHFLYTDYVSPLVPKWLGFPAFWTYFGGAALIAAGIAIILKILLKPVALLLAAMLFTWFMIIHVPDAVAHPYLLQGNEIVSAFDALQFCGIALVISTLGNMRSLNPGDLPYTAYI